MTENANAAKIRAENDQFRKTGRGGRLTITQGIQAMGEKAVQEIIAKIAAYNNFDEGSDPWQEHDFGKIIHDGQKVLWKLDYYDLAMKFASPDPSDPKVTTRILTIMTAEEY